MSGADWTDMASRPLRLDNVVQDYAWGSTTLLSGLRGLGASARPQAEVWMGAHAAAPSKCKVDGELIGLDHLVAADASVLGPADQVSGGSLPYLMKLLAAASPLSLQAHPTKAMAEAGFARENELGIALDDPRRSYKDDNHKPELICALTPFRALSGFRAASATAETLASLGCDRLDLIVERLRQGAEGALIGVVEHVLTLSTDEGRRLADQVGAAVAVDGPHQLERSIARRVSEIYPGDPGIVIALLLEAVTLEPGDAMYLGAGRLHAYVDGLGVEIMAASDNVLRGGLTPKHVDVAELVAILSPVIEPIEVLRGMEVEPSEFEYRTPAPEFLLSRIEVDERVERMAAGPEIVLVTSGSFTIGDEALAPADSMFVPAGTTWSAVGTGQMFRARVAGLEIDQIGVRA